MSDRAQAIDSVATPRKARARLRWWRPVALVAGDLVVFGVFAGIGRASHHEASGFGALGALVGTAAPFAIAWFAVSPLLGAFRPDRTRALQDMLRRTEIAWFAAWPLAMLLRYIGDTLGSVPFTGGFFAFAAVALATNALLLGLWRGAFALVYQRLV